MTMFAMTQTVKKCVLTLPSRQPSTNRSIAGGSCGHGENDLPAVLLFEAALAGGSEEEFEAGPIGNGPRNPLRVALDSRSVGFIGACCLPPA